jgi:hypothetical protein
MAKQKFGEGICDACGERVVWKESDGGSLSYTCQDCDYRGYAPANTQAKRLIEGMVKKAEPEEKKPEKSPVAAPLSEKPPIEKAPPVEAPKKKSFFDY